MAHNKQMTPIDTAWLRMDRPNNLMMIVGVLTLSGPVDIDRVERVLGQRIGLIPKFRQKVVRNPQSYVWVDDPHFAIGNHIKRVRLPGQGGRGELERLVSDLASQPLNMARPHWQFHIVEDYEGGAALIFRIHHAIGDGISLIGAMLLLTDKSADGDAGAEILAEPPASEGEDAEAEKAHSSFWVTRAALRSFDLSAAMWKAYMDYTSTVWKAYLTMLTHPAKVVEYAEKGSGVTAELARLLLMKEDSRTRFKGQLSGVKRLAWSRPLELTEVKAVSHANHCSVNDLMMAAVTGALRAYLEEKGDPTEGVEVRTAIPVNLRPPGRQVELGNWFGLVALSLPVGVADPQERLREVHERMAALRSSYEPAVTLGLMAALGAAPKMLQDKLFDLLLGRMTAVMTNVPGPQYPLYLGGSRWREAMFWVPQSANIGMGVSVLSFDGHIQFGLTCDTALVPDPQRIADLFESEFEAYVYLTLMANEGAGAKDQRIDS